MRGSGLKGEERFDNLLGWAGAGSAVRQQVPPVLALRGNVLGLGSVWGSGLSGGEEAKMRYGS
jgi:hypothetical protein